MLTKGGHVGQGGLFVGRSAFRAANGHHCSPERHDLTRGPAEIGGTLSRWSDRVYVDLQQRFARTGRKMPKEKVLEDCEKGPHFFGFGSGDAKSSALGENFRRLR